MKVVIWALHNLAKRCIFDMLEKDDCIYELNLYSMQIGTSYMNEPFNGNVFRYCIFYKLQSRILTAIFLFSVIAGESRAQSCFGIGVGSENFHFRTGKQRHIVPNLSYEHLLSNMRVALYVEAAQVKRSAENSDSYVNDQGETVPYNEQFKYSHVLLQAGFKFFVSGDADKRTPVFILGGGLADCISRNRYTAKGTNPLYPVDESRTEFTNSFGIGFFAGAQYYLKPLILQLKGNLDFLTKQVIEYGGKTNVHTGMRLSVSIPFRSLN